MSVNKNSEIRKKLGCTNLPLLFPLRCVQLVDSSFTRGLYVSSRPTRKSNVNIFRPRLKIYRFHDIFRFFLLPVLARAISRWDFETNETTRKKRERERDRRNVEFYRNELVRVMNSCIVLIKANVISRNIMVK